jgi:phosphoglycerate kinase
MNLPKLDSLEVSGKRVLLRLDLDTEPTPNDLRIKASEETLNYLKDKGAQIIIIAHKGRPEGAPNETLSLKPFQPLFDKWGAMVEENLRFDPEEEKNGPDFAKKLASLGDVYVNDAFAASHREHASIVGLPKLLPHAAGLHFIKEVENLSKVLENPQKPVVAIIGGAKEDKLSYLPGFKVFADKIYLVGALPKFMEESTDPKVLVANLLPDKEDLTVNSIEEIEEEVKSAGTIVLAGPAGKFEEEGHLLGTKRIFEAVAKSKAFRVAGGGDTEEAINKLGLRKGFDWISVGGGAMLEFLSKGTLPGIDALLA